MVIGFDSMALDNMNWALCRKLARINRHPFCFGLQHIDSLFILGTPQGLSEQLFLDLFLSFFCLINSSTPTYFDQRGLTTFTHLAQRATRVPSTCFSLYHFSRSNEQFFCLLASWLLLLQFSLEEMLLLKLLGWGCPQAIFPSEILWLFLIRFVQFSFVFTQRTWGSIIYFADSWISIWHRADL